MDGNEDSSNGLTVYMEAKRITRAKVILNEIRRSSTVAGSGITINIKMATTATAVTISLFFEIPGIRLKF
jgi:hypothetical protein